MYFNRVAAEINLRKFVMIDFENQKIVDDFGNLRIEDFVTIF